MSESASRRAIYDRLRQVPYIGLVYDYERWAVDWGKFIALFRDSASAQIRGWEICRCAMSATKISVIEEERTHQYRIRGYMSVNDAAATEKTFNLLIDLICNQFRGDHTFDGVCVDAGPVSVETVDTRTFGGVLCHYAELVVPVHEIGVPGTIDAVVFDDGSSMVYDDGSQVT